MTNPSPTPAPASDRQWIGQAIDFGALVAFLGSYVFFRMVQGLESADAMVHATWVLVGASAVALIAGYVLEKRVAPLPLFVGAMALVFGVLTIVFKDPSLIQIKITVQNAVLAAVLLGTLPFGIYPFKVLLRRAFAITDAGWRGLSLRYGLFFLAVAIVNEIVRQPQVGAWLIEHLDIRSWGPKFSGWSPYDLWMGFRGILWIASTAFGIWQVFFIMKHLIKEEEPQPVSPDPGL